jgi:hypothetical protein
MIEIAEEFNAGDKRERFGAKRQLTAKRGQVGEADERAEPDD